MSSTPQETREIKNELFQSVMKGEWNEVVKIYEEHPEAHETKITRAGDTALHVAVYENKEGTIKELIGKIQCRKKALEIGNEQGNTPLHFAASMGSVAMCNLIAEADPEAVRIRNKKGETPLFVAALHGKKEAFLYLQGSFGGDGPWRFTRRFNGDTILHCAIAGEYFDLALQIIDHYKDLVDNVNEQGIFVDNVKVEGPDDESKDHKDGNYPDNYKTCIQFFQLLLNVVGCGKKKDEKKTDEEAPEGQGHRLFPATSDTRFGLLKLAAKTLLTILGLGHSGIRRIRDEKRKHILAVQIVDEILKRTSTYQDNTTGRSPEAEASHKQDETSAYNLHDIVEAGGSGSGDNKGKERRDTKRTMRGTPIPRDAQHVVTEIVMRILKLLVEKEENFERTMKETSISLAAQDVIPEIVERIVKLLFVEKEKKSSMETPILLAAKHGIIVDRILECFPIAIHDTNVDNKNIAMLAAEYKQLDIFQCLLQRDMLGDNILGIVDKDGNSVLHLAAKLEKDRPWHIPGAALQMQWEYKWYEYVRECMPAHFNLNNNNEETPQDVFQPTHNQLVKEGAQWLREASNSCSVVAALVAGVAFATSASFPGGFNDRTEAPNLVNHPAFSVFSLASLVALCFSVTALIMFLAIITSRNEEKDFGKELPGKLLIGLSSLFLSIASMLVSFCAGHFFVLQNELKFAALPVYAVACLPASLFAVAHFPLYFDVVRAIFKKVPQRSLNLIRL